MIEKIMLVISGVKSFAMYLIIPSGVILFMPDDWLNYLRLFDFKKSFGDWIASTFLLTCSIFIVDLVGRASDRFVKKRERMKKLRDKERTLENLTFKEREIVKKIYENDSAIFELNDASVHKLELLSVILRPDLSKGQASFSYTLQPWVLNYLQKHPDFFKGDK